MIVRLEGEHGALWLNPEHVLAVHDSGEEGWCTVAMVNHTWHKAKGTPDEVANTLARTEATS